MEPYPTVGLDTVLRWAELGASVLLFALLAGVALYIVVVVHHTRRETPPRRAGTSTSRASSPTH